MIELVTTSTPTEGEGVFIATISMQKLEDELEVSVLKRTAFENQVLFYKLQIDRFRFDHPNLSEDILAFARLNRTKAILQKTLDILLEKIRGHLKILNFSLSEPTKPKFFLSVSYRIDDFQEKSV